MGREIKFRVWDKVLNRWRIVEMREDDTYYEFTGLHDKNGKEIYEGDIVRQVRYGKYNQIKLLVVEIPDFYYTIAEFELDSPDMEIIGNIYENPHLLKEDNENNKIPGVESI